MKNQCSSGGHALLITYIYELIHSSPQLCEIFKIIFHILRWRNWKKIWSNLTQLEHVILMELGFEAKQSSSRIWAINHYTKPPHTKIFLEHYIEHSKGDFEQNTVEYWGLSCPVYRENVMGSNSQWIHESLRRVHKRKEWKTELG